MRRVGFDAAAQHVDLPVAVAHARLGGVVGDIDTHDDDRRVGQPGRTDRPDQVLGWNLRGELGCEDHVGVLTPRLVPAAPVTAWTVVEPVEHPFEPLEGGTPE